MIAAARAPPHLPCLSSPVTPCPANAPLRRPASASSRSAARRRSSTPSGSSRSCAPRATRSSPTYDGADLVIVNTCGFIDAAVAESLDAIGEALAENGKVIVTGCLGAKAGGDFVREAHPNVLAVTGPHATHEVMTAVHAHLPKPHDPFVDLVPPQGIKLTPKHYAYLKISEGCNHRCTFCIIPSMRGDLVSRPIGDVLEEAESAVARPA